VSEEAYFGLAGEGYLELHDPEHGFRSIPIHPGTYVQFPPNTLHRSVSSGGLEVLAIMGAAGLAERGDARIYFGKEIDEDAGAYERERARVDEGLDGALARRDASVRAYMALMELWERDRDAYRRELERFMALHRQALLGVREELRDLSERVALRGARHALDRIDALPSVMGDADIAAMTRDCGAPRLGMCGILRQV
jgi:CRP-like cAMP-binding protein